MTDVTKINIPWVRVEDGLQLSELKSLKVEKLNEDQKQLLVTLAMNILLDSPMAKDGKLDFATKENPWKVLLMAKKWTQRNPSQDLALLQLVWKIQGVYSSDVDGEYWTKTQKMIDAVWSWTNPMTSVFLQWKSASAADEDIEIELGDAPAPVVTTLPNRPLTEEELVNAETLLASRWIPFDLHPEDFNNRAKLEAVLSSITQFSQQLGKDPTQAKIIFLEMVTEVRKVNELKDAEVQEMIREISTQLRTLRAEVKSDYKKVDVKKLSWNEALYAKLADFDWDNRVDSDDKSLVNGQDLFLALKYADSTINNKLALARNLYSIATLQMDTATQPIAPNSLDDLAILFNDATFLKAFRDNLNDFVSQGYDLVTILTKTIPSATRAKLKKQEAVTTYLKEKQLSPELQAAAAQLSTRAHDQIRTILAANSNDPAMRDVQAQLRRMDSDGSLMSLIAVNSQNIALNINSLLQNSLGKDEKNPSLLQDILSNYDVRLWSDGKGKYAVGLGLSKDFRVSSNENINTRISAWVMLGNFLPMAYVSIWGTATLNREEVKKAGFADFDESVITVNASLWAATNGPILSAGIDWSDKQRAISIISQEFRSKVGELFSTIDAKTATSESVAGTISQYMTTQVTSAKSKVDTHKLSQAAGKIKNILDANRFEERSDEERQMILTWLAAMVGDNYERSLYENAKGLDFVTWARADILVIGIIGAFGAIGGLAGLDLLKYNSVNFNSDQNQYDVSRIRQNAALGMERIPVDSTNKMIEELQRRLSVFWNVEVVNEGGQIVLKWVGKDADILKAINVFVSPDDAKDVWYVNWSLIIGDVADLRYSVIMQNGVEQTIVLGKWEIASMIPLNKDTAARFDKIPSTQFGASWKVEKSKTAVMEWLNLKNASVQELLNANIPALRWIAQKYPAEHREIISALTVWYYKEAATQLIKIFQKDSVLKSLTKVIDALKAFQSVAINWDVNFYSDDYQKWAYLVSQIIDMMMVIWVSPEAKKDAAAKKIPVQQAEIQSARRMAGLDRLLNQEATDQSDIDRMNSVSGSHRYTDSDKRQAEYYNFDVSAFKAVHERLVSRITDWTAKKVEWFDKMISFTARNPYGSKTTDAFLRKPAGVDEEAIGGIYETIDDASIQKYLAYKTVFNGWERLDPQAAIMLNNINTILAAQKSPSKFTSLQLVELIQNGKVVHNGQQITMDRAFVYYLHGNSQLNNKKDLMNCLNHSCWVMLGALTFEPVPWAGGGGGPWVPPSREPMNLEFNDVALGESVESIRNISSMDTITIWGSAIVAPLFGWIVPPTNKWPGKWGTNLNEWNGGWTGTGWSNWGSGWDR